MKYHNLREGKLIVERIKNKNDDKEWNGDGQISIGSVWSAGRDGVSRITPV